MRFYLIGIFSRLRYQWRYSFHSEIIGRLRLKTCHTNLLMCLIEPCCLRSLRWVNGHCYGTEAPEGGIMQSKVSFMWFSFCWYLPICICLPWINSCVVWSNHLRSPVGIVERSLWNVLKDWHVFLWHVFTWLMSKWKSKINYNNKCFTLEVFWWIVTHCQNPTILKGAVLVLQGTESRINIYYLKYLDLFRTLDVFSPTWLCLIASSCPCLVWDDSLIIVTGFEAAEKSH